MKENLKCINALITCQERIESGEKKKKKIWERFGKGMETASTFLKSFEKKCCQRPNLHNEDRPTY
jgi:hypothetical protein